MLRAIPVDDVRRENILAARVEAGPRWTGLCARFREALRLCAAPRRVQFRLPVIRSDTDTVAVAAHRFEESIGGCRYVIEVASVADDRWRACIVRRPGVPTALMPFYGR